MDKYSIPYFARDYVSMLTKGAPDKKIRSDWTARDAGHATHFIWEDNQPSGGAAKVILPLVRNDEEWIGVTSTSR